MEWDRIRRTVGGTTLALAVIAVVVGGDERRVHVDRVGDRLAETVAGERHDDWLESIEWMESGIGFSPRVLTKMDPKDIWDKDLGGIRTVFK